MSSDAKLLPKYRSVLPHEPLPSSLDSEESPEKGYVHLQGSLVPKLCSTANDAGSATIPDVSADAIEQAILKSLAPQDTLCVDKADQSESSRTNNTHMPPGLPNHMLSSVEIVDPSQKPFNKVRLCYNNSRAARDVVSYLRHNAVSPMHLLENTLDLSAIMDEIKTKASADSQEKALRPIYSSRPIQATQITRQPLPPDEISWSRSNPPKFRRLIHASDPTGVDAATLRAEREATRFLFLTNVLIDERGEPTFDNQEDDTTNAAGNIISLLATAPHVYLDALRAVLDRYDSSGLGVELFVPSPGKGGATKWLKSFHIGMRSHEDAVAVMEALQGEVVDMELHLPAHSHRSGVQGSTAITTVQTGRLFFDFVAPTKRSWAKKANGDSIATSGGPKRSDCTSLTKDVAVPGLVVIPEFLSEEEEASLMAALTGPNAPWAPSQATMNKIGSGNVRRRVQHYGYVFDYETADVLRDRSALGAGCPPMPAIDEKLQKENSLDDANSEDLEEYVAAALKDCNGWDVLAGIIERTRRTTFNENSLAGTDDKSEGSREGTAMRYPSLNQLTINEYKPGQGIGSHVDTPSAFGDGLISISMNAGVVMEFRKQGGEKSKDRKLVYLPPRSLCLMSGPARYEWEHMIVSRSTDTVEGVVKPRELRVSLTLRTALSESADSGGNAFPLELIESRNFPPRWNSGNSEQKYEADTRGDDEVDISTPATEREHVHAVYDAIATQWHHTRGKRGVLWPGATQFLQNLPMGSIVADVGCGDGKYFPAIVEAGSYVIGSDISLPLLQTAIESGRRSFKEETPESRRVHSSKEMLNARPSVAVADCMHVPLRSGSVDAAICIAVMHHLSTKPRRIRCLSELARIVKVGGMINIQAWAIDQEQGSKRRFAARDVFVPFNAQPKYLEKVKSNGKKTPKESESESESNAHNKGVAEMYSEVYEGSEYDERKGLVVFQRYCHMYRQGELEELVSEIPNVALVESGFESGNYFVILRVM